jgi:hypothetical protein
LYAWNVKTVRKLLLGTKTLTVEPEYFVLTVMFLDYWFKNKKVLLKKYLKMIYEIGKKTLVID